MQIEIEITPLCTLEKEKPCMICGELNILMFFMTYYKKAGWVCERCEEKKPKRESK